MFYKPMHHAFQFNPKAPQASMSTIRNLCQNFLAMQERRHLTIGSLIWSGSKNMLLEQRRRRPGSATLVVAFRNPWGQLAEAVQSFKYCSPSSSRSKEKRALLVPHIL